ncbi:MAG TPA: glycosyltransferase [Phormidium sp.]
MSKNGSTYRASSSETRQTEMKNLMLFDLTTTGHHPGYINHLTRYWQDKELAGRLSVVVAPDFLEKHSTIVDSVSNCPTIKFLSVTTSEANSLPPKKSPVHRAVRALQEWQLVCKYASLLEVDKALLMYMDSFQTALSLHRKAPCTLSGIYFRPTLHYSNFADYVPLIKDKIQHWRERVIAPRVFCHPNLETIFTLDPFAVDYFNQLCHSSKAMHLPDPVHIHKEFSLSEAEELRREFRIEEHRRIFLLFGSLDSRKGVTQTLEAIKLLPSKICQNLCLLIAGPIEPSYKQSIQLLAADLIQTKSAQIIVHDTLIADRNIQSYFQLANVILAPYQRHVGMSAILVRATAAQKPLLSSNHGLMGEIVRRYNLGLAVDSTSPSEIAAGLTKYLSNPSDAFGDLHQMKLFAEKNSAEKFASTIFESI